MSKSSSAGATGGIWVPGVDCFGFVGTWTPTRIAAGNYGLALTAAGNSPFLAIPTISFMGGVRLISVDFVYQITTVNLTSITAALYRKQSVTGQASAMSTLFGPTALTAATSGNPRVVNWQVSPGNPTASSPIGAPGIIVGAHENDPNAGSDYLPDTEEWIELALVNPGTSVFTFHGAWLYGDKLI